MKFLRTFFISSIILFGGCDPLNEYAIEWEGEVGSEVPITIDSLTPETDVILDVSPGEGTFVVDTGAPLTLVDTGHYNISPGYEKTDATALGLFFPSLPVVFENIFDDSLNISGIIGSNIVSMFNWELNYSEKYIKLHTDNLPDYFNTGSKIGFSLDGGGKFRLSTGETVDVGATRYLVKINIEGKEILALLDTGASYLVITQGVLDSLPDIQRVEHGTTQIVTVYGVMNAPLIEIDYMSFSDEYTSTRIDDVYTVIVENDFFADLSWETGREISALLGGAYLQNFHLKFNLDKRLIYAQPIDAANKVKPASGENRASVRWPIHLE
ncbi:MAG: aspartyl protease family protein [Deltaproteobacteria bacterium]|nr:aspartyl protease family protein [Deltaproteobacteria bacterium]